MAEQSNLQQIAKIPQQLVLKSGVCSVDIKDETDVIFKDKETGEISLFCLKLPLSSTLGSKNSVKKKRLQLNILYQGT